jgi:hypothetical protein
MKPIQVKTFMTEVYEQMKHMHHLAPNIPVHDILGEFYSKWEDFSDDFVETYSGAYGDIHGSMLISVVDPVDPMPYIKEAMNMLIQTQELCVNNPDLLNILADMIGLCNHTIYLLKRAYNVQL